MRRLPRGLGACAEEGSLAVDKGPSPSQCAAQILTKGSFAREATPGVFQGGQRDFRGAMHTYLDFEKPIAELEGKVQELRLLAQDDPTVSITDEVAKLEQKAAQLLQDTYSALTPWQKLQVARHPRRPHFVDYVERLIEDFTPLAGDRLFGEDAAIMGGLGRFRGRSVVVIGHEKGSDTQGRMKHNFGLARPRAIARPFA